VSDSGDEGSQSPSASTGAFWLWLPVGAYMAVIFFVSSLSDPTIPSSVSDVSLHGASYFGLTLLLIRALARSRWSGVTLVTLAAAWAIAVLYGVTDEWHQSFVPNRHPEFRDVVSDAIGALAAAVAVGAWGIIRRL
jgi:VanZ family protein